MQLRKRFCNIFTIFLCLFRVAQANLIEQNVCHKKLYHLRNCRTDLQRPFIGPALQDHIRGSRPR